jgi:uncharacterized membrane protein YgaE (UPF0421/DUF939 family)
MQIKKLSRSDVVFVLALTISCLVSYLVAIYILRPFVDQTNDSLGGMWAAVATVFVFRSTNETSMSAARARLFATSVSFVLCLLYLLILPFSAVGMAVLIGLGALIAIFLGRREDVITTGITTAVVMVVAELGPADRDWQPILRLLDTALGIGVGVATAWICGSLFLRSRSSTTEH